MLVLAAPRAAIPQSWLERILAQRFSSRDGSARVVKDFMTSLLQEQRALSPYLRHDFAKTALQLMRLTLMEHAVPQPHRKSSRSLQSQMNTYIDDHLRDADLSLASIAAACHCSKRYVHKMFSREGQTAARYILQRRLIGSATDLARAELAHLSITDIAVSWGFKSSSTFSRVFRRRFRISPRLYRQTSSSLPERTSSPGIKCRSPADLD
jgi:AraC-like DNA-binding protein